MQLHFIVSSEIEEGMFLTLGLTMAWMVS